MSKFRYLRFKWRDNQLFYEGKLVADLSNSYWEPREAAIIANNHEIQIEDYQKIAKRGKDLTHLFDKLDVMPARLAARLVRYGYQPSRAGLKKYHREELTDAWPRAVIAADVESMDDAKVRRFVKKHVHKNLHVMHQLDACLDRISAKDGYCHPSERPFERAGAYRYAAMLLAGRGEQDCIDYAFA